MDQQPQELAADGRVRRAFPFAISLSGDVSFDLVTKNRFLLSAQSFYFAHFSPAGRWLLPASFLFAFVGAATWPGSDS